MRESSGRERSGRASFGHTVLPEEQERALREATRLEWTSLGVLAVGIALLAAVLGSSQAMKTAWIEDMLSLLPPAVFLIASRVSRRAPSDRHPYGMHRATGIGHLVAAVALVVMGGYLLVDSAIGLVSLEHPSIGGVVVLGQVVWLGWLMIPALVVTSIPPVLLGRAKLKRAEALHDRVLYADADMNKADWQTGLAAALGVLGIGFGLWWADSAAAILISASILRDGAVNVRTSVSALMDARAGTEDDEEPHPVGRAIDEHLRSLPWVQDAQSRIRDQGHVFHVESFVVPRPGARLDVDVLADARDECSRLDWKVRDLVLVPVPELPRDLLPAASPPGEE